MNNKCMQIVGNNLPNNLSHIGLYNLQVKQYLDCNPLTELQQHAVKIFKDNAYKGKLTNEQYNKQVAAFNKHGFIIRKKGIAFVNEAIDKNYSYINYPFLDREAVHETMRNYRQYVYAYNKKVEKENVEINNYNNDVFTTTSKIDKIKIKSFKEENNYLFTREYNTEVAEENDGKERKIIKKKRIQKVKFGSEVFFHVLVGFYVKQLKIHNLNKMQMNLPTSVLKNSLPILKVNHKSLADHKIDEIPRLDVCKKTAQNHVKRLREAGVFNNYTFINSNKPINVNFNTKILVILDGKLPKKQIAENQQLNYVIGKKLPDNKDTTRTILKEKEKKSNVFNIDSLITGSRMQSLNIIPAVSYKNTQKQDCEKKEKIPPRDLKYIEKISENFKNRLQDERLLAEDLATGVYKNYTGLRYDYLKKVTDNCRTSISLQQFANVLQQDVLKSAAKIWKSKTVFVGEWKKTINQSKENLFIGLRSKQQMIYKLEEYRWKLNFARKWFAKNNRNALFPFKYFDSTRTKSGELGFFGLHSVWKSHLNYKQSRIEELNAAKQNANKRQRILSSDKKLERAISNFYSGKWSYNRLSDYVQDNLGHDYYTQLPKLVKNNTKFTA